MRIATIFLLAASLTSAATFTSCSDKAKHSESDSQYMVQKTTPVIQKLKSEHSLPVVVDMFAKWCGPCTQFRPTFQSMEKKYDGRVDFRTVDIDENHELADKLGIESIPTVLFLDREGREVARYIGLMPAEQLSAAIDTLIKMK